MATYKIIQDIEAEDHIIGPLTLRQFIFALIAVFCFYLSFLCLTKHAGFLLVLFVPPGLFFGFFALPFGRDQPTEVWALGKLRFWLKPRKRIWDQSSVKQLVTITVPKKVERVLTDGLNQYEVQSRLSALANTLDSRGWAIKNSNLTTPALGIVAGNGFDSDRLVQMDTSINEAPEDQAPNGADILEDSNPISHQFDQMINQSAANHRQELIQQMNSDVPMPPPTPQPQSQLQQPTTVAPTSQATGQQWFMPQAQVNQTTAAAPLVTASDVSAQDATPGEAALVAQIKANRDAQQAFYGNLRTLQPIDNNGPTQQTPPPVPPATIPEPPAPLTYQSDPVILSLANKPDFNIDTLAREAKRAKGEDNESDEVVISLH